MGNSKSTLSKQNINLTNERGKQQKNDFKEPMKEIYKSEHEIDRMQRAHFTLQHLFRNNFSCPMEETLKMGGRVLDGGCGSGAWLLDMAMHYPNSHFFGVDIAEIYPSQIKLANVKFHQCDLMQLEQLGFEKNSFHMMQIKNMQLVLDVKDYAQIVEKMLKLLKPGGYFELSEVEIIFSDYGPNFTRIIKMLEMGLKRSTDLNLEKIFFATEQVINIQRETRVIKLGPSGNIVGELYLTNLEEFFTGDIKEVLMGLMDMTPKEYENFWQQCKAECIELETRITFARVWGQKAVI
ncbi:1702_t:CDS:2 [Ambispora gerdemannii]|uniref:1702_t:CDS:1 n=1 Tax=Ambispora gerdemannii TaxID=144530 RepID=A0A9N9CLK9_9GLOM|nr:1702_t:CDS:2 [Ambispora gerdemannii]